MIYHCGTLLTRKIDQHTGKLRNQMPVNIIDNAHDDVDLSIPPTAIGSLLYDRYIKELGDFQFQAVPPKSFWLPNPIPQDIRMFRPLLAESEMYHILTDYN